MTNLIFRRIKLEIRQPLAVCSSSSESYQPIMQEIAENSLH